MNRVDLPDIGFADPQAARLIVRRLKLRVALNDAKASIETLLDLLDHRDQADRDAVAALFDERGDLRADAADRVQRDVAVRRVDDDDVREKELLEGVDVVLQFLEAVGVGLRHGLFSADRGEQVMCADGFSHRLSGGAK